MASYYFWRIYDFCGGENDFMILLIIIGILSGIISGMGIGGGTILIPTLIFFEGVSQHQAQGINLIYFIPTAISALYLHRKNNTIQKDIVKPIVLFGLVGAAVGAFLAVNIDDNILKKIFGGFLFVMGIIEIFKKENKNE